MITFVFGFLETTCGSASSAGSHLSLHPPHEYYGNTTVIEAYMMWEVSLHSVCVPASLQSSLSASQLPVRWFHSCFSLALCVCVCARARVCVLHGRAATPPPTHKHTDKLKCRSRAVSFQSLPSFLSPCPRALKASPSSCRALRALMDRRRMDADGGRGVRGVHRDRRTRKLAAVVAVQNVLVAACLLVTLYVYWDVQRRVSKL